MQLLKADYVSEGWWEEREMRGNKGWCGFKDIEKHRGSFGKQRMGLKLRDVVKQDINGISDGFQQQEAESEFSEEKVAVLQKWDDQALGHWGRQLGINFSELLCAITDPCDLGYYSLLIG